ncbi:unnamed protein product [Soboliphyme baturini]|uniref:Uncharacterized protein n=1 Tax=Soboliphyme baturini TaxID=241478 RepID=A0A183IK30_9BILA|nr:unnamed protein product [Soboliphyme baturini]
MEEGVANVQNRAEEIVNPVTTDVERPINKIEESHPAVEDAESKKPIISEQSAEKGNVTLDGKENENYSNSDAGSGIMEKIGRDNTVIQSRQIKVNFEADDGQKEKDIKIKTLVEGKRPRQKVERLESTILNTPSKGVDIPNGKGIKLHDIPYGLKHIDLEFLLTVFLVETMIKKAEVLDLKYLHRVVFGKFGTNLEIRKHLRVFSGYEFDETSEDFTKLKYSKKVVGHRRSVSRRSTKKLVEKQENGKGKKMESSTSEEATPKKRKNNTGKVVTSRSTAKKVPKAKKATTPEQLVEASTSTADKKPEIPSDEGLIVIVKDLLKGLNLEQVTMKDICDQCFLILLPVALFHEKSVEELEKFMSRRVVFTGDEKWEPQINRRIGMASGRRPAWSSLNRRD